MAIIGGIPHFQTYPSSYDFRRNSMTVFVEPKTLDPLDQWWRPHWILWTPSVLWSDGLVAPLPRRRCGEKLDVTGSWSEKDVPIYRGRFMGLYVLIYNVNSWYIYIYIYMYIYIYVYIYISYIYIFNIMIFYRDYEHRFADDDYPLVMSVLWKPWPPNSDSRWSLMRGRFPITWLTKMGRRGTEISAQS